MVSLKCRSPSYVQASCRLRFAVSDTGIGINQTDLNQLFRPFTQVDNSLQRSYEGAGLGLSVVKELAELMGGMVGAESEPGRGSTFWFEIPVKPVDNPIEQCEQLDQPLLSGDSFQGTRNEWLIKSHLRVLLAEDNRVNQQFILLCLKQIGAFCDVAADGQEAIALFSNYPYDVVLMDIHMPDVDGITAMRSIRAINPDAIVVAVTADALPKACNRLLQVGFNAYLTKPFRLHQMQDILLKVLSVNHVPG